MKRSIRRIIWHCTATPENREVTVEMIRQWHKQRGFNDIGYHFVIDLEGKVRPGRSLDLQGAHTKFYNSDSVGICYVGGLDAKGKPTDTRNEMQRRALYHLTAELLSRFPDAEVCGHNEFANKACPSFDAKADWAAELKRRAGETVQA